MEERAEKIGRKRGASAIGRVRAAHGEFGRREAVKVAETAVEIGNIVEAAGKGDLSNIYLAVAREIATQFFGGKF